MGGWVGYVVCIVYYGIDQVGVWLCIECCYQVVYGVWFKQVVWVEYQQV